MPPSITVEPSDVTAESGSTVVFTCSASGEPQPDIVWHRQENHEASSLVVPSRSVRGQLTVENVTPKDEGVYVCEAVNEAGRASASASLAVHGKRDTDCMNSGASLSAP